MLIQRIKQNGMSNAIRTLSVFAGGSLVISIISGVGGIIQSRWISPEVFGEFRKYGILTGYLNIGLICVNDALMRQYPYLIGKGDQREALEVAAAAKWWYLALSYIVSLLFVALAALSFLRGDARAVAGWGVQIVAVWIAFYGVYLGVMYRTSQDFKRLTYNNLYSSTVGFVLLVIVKLWGYWGVIVRNGVQLVFGLWLNHKHVPVSVRGVWDPKRLWGLAKMSLPISVPGYVSTSLTTATLSFVILRYLGQADLGIYAISLSLQGMAMTVTTSLAQMFYPKIMHKYGETESFTACIRYALKPTFLNVVLSTAIVAVLCIVIDPFVRLIIPKYVAAIPIIRIMSLSIILTAAALPFVVFVSALRYRTIGCLALVRFAACFVLIGCLPKTLAIIAWSVVGAEIVYVLVGYGLIVFTERYGTGVTVGAKHAAT